ncbi:hypothetical protein M885DRAFT_617966 [Pelagophyceae sp. CCMP2097]|nr:hypothetical protein M885DRAFT_617966 [Pelagophyceae sp. CCMP2097]
MKVELLHALLFHYTRLALCASASADTDAAALRVLYQQYPPSAFTELATRSKKGVVLDVGLNNGKDTAWFLSQGYSVLAVDASPVWVAEARKRWAAEIEERRLLVLCVGLGEDLGHNLTFYVSKQSTRSSFSRAKASKNGAIGIAAAIPVTVVPCEALFLALPIRVHFAKVDIEELDYACIAAVAHRLPPEKRSDFLTWENHFRRDHAGVGTWPAFDMRLILAIIGHADCDQIKMSYGVDGDTFGEAMPNDSETAPPAPQIGDPFSSKLLNVDFAKEPGYFDFSMQLQRAK